jgi:tetratricopeptide (TPR) repeat protein
MKFFAARVSTAFFFFAFVSASFAATAPAPTDADCERLGHQVEDFINCGQPALVVELMNFNELGRRVCEGLDLTKAETASFITNFGKGAKSSLDRSLKGWKQARYISVSTVNGEKRVLLRLVSEQGALNFLDWVCTTKADGNLQIVDCYNFLSAELMSETSRRAALPLLAGRNKSFLEKLTSRESSYLNEVPKINEAGQALQKGEFKNALAILESLPAELKKTTGIRLLRLQAAQSCDDKKYLQVIEEWEKSAPNDPALSLISIDGCVLRKDYAGCVRCITNVQKRVGPDGYLEYLRAIVLYQAGNLPDCVAALKHAIQVEPALTKPYDFWFTLALNGKQWAEVVEALELFDANFPKADIWTNIQKSDTWTAFRDTSECKAWVDKRQHRQQALE